MKFKDLWDLESAMQVLGHKTVDAKLWAEAVEWLLQYGPPEIRQLLLDASEIATGTAFPEMKPTHYTPEGQPCYDISALAKSLGITEEQTRDILRQKKQKEGGDQVAESDLDTTIH
jgi:hypothetical protein